MRVYAKFLAGVCLATLLYALPALAQSATASNEAEKASVTTTNEMVVTATRSEKQIDEAPASVSVITQEDMSRFHIDTLDEALQHEVGVYVKRSKGIIESLPVVSMRGLYGQERNLVMLDGVPMNRGYAGMVAWNMVGMNNVQRVEIIRGPSSALYGGNAMGGVINIITNLPSKTEAGARIGYGTDETLSYAAYAGDRWDRFALRAGYEYEDTAGYASSFVTRSVSAGSGSLTGGYGTTNTSGDPVWVVGDKGDQPASRYNFNAVAAYDTTSTGQIRLNYQMGEHKYDYDHPNTYLRDSAGNEAWSGTVQAGSGKKASVSPYNYVYYNGKAQENFYLPSLSYQEKFGAMGFKGVLGYQNWHKWYTVATGYGNSNYDDSVGTRSDTWTDTWTMDLQGDLRVFSSHYLTFGVYGRSDDMSQEDWNLTYYRDEDSKTTKNKTAQGKDHLLAAYIQDEWRALPQLTIYGGLRLDYWQAYDGKAGNVGDERTFDEPTDSAISPKVSAVWNPLADTFVRASVGRAFRPPNLYELYRTWPSGSYTNYSNPDLKPETLWSYELGADQYLWQRKVKLSATIFHTDLQDAIESYKASDGNYYRDNVSEATINGIELAASVMPWSWLKLWGNFTYNDSEVKENTRNPAAEGKALPDMPEMTANLGLDATYKWFTFNVVGEYTGRIYSDELNNDVEGVYGGDSKRWVWDTKLSYRPIERVELSISVNNIFDKTYYNYYLCPGRTYFAEIKFTW